MDMHVCDIHILGIAKIGVVVIFPSQQAVFSECVNHW